MVKLYTFGFVYQHGPDLYIEEVDVRADNYVDARAQARKEAEDDLEPGWIKMIDMPPGGTAGMVQF